MARRRLGAEALETLRHQLRRQEAALEEAAELIALAATPTRLRLLWLLLEEGEVPVTRLVESVGRSSSAVSQQLWRLRAARLVETRREAQWIFYRPTDHPFLRLLGQVLPIFNS